MPRLNKSRPGIIESGFAEASKDSAAGVEEGFARFDSHKGFNSPSFKNATKNVPSSTGESSSQSEDAPCYTTESSGESVVGQDSIRELHFADTLALIEGRVARNSWCLIQRFAHPEPHYNEDVELEHFSPALRCPRPLKWANTVKMHRLIQVEIVDGSDEPELPGPAMHSESRERPENPTPDRAVFHNDETTSV